MILEGDWNLKQENAFDTVTFVTVGMKVLFTWCKRLVIHS
jgi:hypothetical protein